MCVFGSCIVMQYVVSVLLLQSFLYFNCVLGVCGCCCSASLPQGAMGWSVIVAFTGHTHFLVMINEIC